MDNQTGQILQDYIERAKNGDNEAFYAIFDLLNDRLFGYALSHTKSRDEALDIVQETFIDLWKALPSFVYKNNESFYGFVFLILKRKIYRYYRINPQTVELDEQYISESYVLEVEDYRYLEKVIGLLSEKYQEVLRLRYWSSLQFKEIAVCMNIKEGTAKVLHHRALKILQGELNNLIIK